MSTLPVDPSIVAELRALEPIFHHPELGIGPEELTADDFWEVGASGTVYDRATVIRAVNERGPVPGEDRWVVGDVACRALGSDTYAFTYRLDQDGRLSRRLTLWRRTSDRWQILYHQGTLISDRPRTP